MPLKLLPQTCTPRADVLAGQFAAADFAARLEQVVSDPAGYADYGDPVKFFALTYPTGGMKRLLTGVFGRLSGQDVPGAENPVVRFQTSFGGGKTHGLIAAYHVAKGFQPASEFFDAGFAGVISASHQELHFVEERAAFRIRLRCIRENQHPSGFVELRIRSGMARFGLPFHPCEAG